MSSGSPFSSRPWGAVLVWILVLTACCPRAVADCVDYADYMHWAGSGPIVPEFFSSFDFGGIAIQDDIAFVAAVQYGVKIVDLSDRKHPQLLASLPGYAYDVKVRGHYAYTTLNGISIIDIADPEHPQVVGNVDMWDSRDIALVGQYALVTGWGSGLVVVDIGDPAAPAVVCGVPTGYCWGLAVDGDVAYVATTDLVLVDIANPLDPSIICTLETPLDALTIAVAEDHVLVFDENGLGSGSLLIVDAAVTGNPHIVGRLDCDSWARGIVVEGDLVFLTGNGLTAIDIDDPAHPQVLGRAYAGHSVTAARLDQYAYVVDGNGPLHVVDVTSPETVRQTGSVATTGVPVGVTLAGPYAYLAEVQPGWPQSGWLEIVDLSDPVQPVLAGKVAMPEWAFEVEVAGDLACVVNEWSLQVVDVSDPEQPTIVGSAAVGARAMAMSGGYVFMAAYPGLRVVDLSDPTAPTPVAGLSTGGGVNDITVAGRLAFLAEDMVGLQVVDVSDPTNPRILGTARTAYGSLLGGMSCVTIDGTRAYLADYESRVHLVDVSDPTDPCERGRTTVSLHGPNLGMDVQAAGGVLYLAANGLQVVDLSGQHVQPAPLRMLGGTWTWWASRLALSEEYVYLTLDIWPSGVVEVWPRQCPRATEIDDPGAIASPGDGTVVIAPNPAAETAAIRFQLPAGGPVAATVYDVAGRRVRELLRESLAAGDHEITWDRRDDGGRRVPSGVYLVRTVTPAGAQIARLVLLR